MIFLVYFISCLPFVNEFSSKLGEIFGSFFSPTILNLFMLHNLKTESIYYCCVDKSLSKTVEMFIAMINHFMVYIQKQNLHHLVSLYKDIVL